MPPLLQNKKQNFGLPLLAVKVITKTTLHVYGTAGTYIQSAMICLNSSVEDILKINSLCFGNYIHSVYSISM